MKQQQNAPDFGNGRFARNLVEKALMNQADRLIQRNPETLTRKEATLLKAEDFEKPEERKCQKTTIGFAIILKRADLFDNIKYILYHIL